MSMIIFFAILIALGIYSSNEPRTHHPPQSNQYGYDYSWYEKELYAKEEPWKRK